jgi:hypothetical protein
MQLIEGENCHCEPEALYRVVYRAEGAAIPNLARGCLGYLRVKQKSL